jgi:hypothetical protein
MDFLVKILDTKATLELSKVNNRDLIEVLLLRLITEISKLKKEFLPQQTYLINSRG